MFQLQFFVALNPTCSTTYSLDGVSTIVYFNNDSIFAERRLGPCSDPSMCVYLRFNGKRIATYAGPTGLKENELAGNLKLYPNPVTHSGIHLITSLEIDSYFLSDILGKSYKLSALKKENEYELSLPGGLENGIYFLSLRKGNESVTKKILVEQME